MVRVGQVNILTTHENKLSVTISVVTATYNASACLPSLIESLRRQTDQDFEWVVADGASRDGTLELLESVKDINVVISSQPDFGIYDGLNRAIQLSSGEYYIVLGADDLAYPESIASFRRIALNQSPDLVSANIMANGRLCSMRRQWPWLYGGFAYVNSHAVGTLIKKSLHEKFGMYSRSYPLVADQLFFKKVGDAGENIVPADFIAGEYGVQGVSSSDVLGVLTENFRIQVETGENKVVQTFLFLLRIIKLFRKI